jgi:uncharacterized membrane protein HdeD (DUF308 family)
LFSDFYIFKNSENILDRMQIRLFKNWWLMTLKGALAIGFGLVVLILQFPFVKRSLTISFGILVIASGILILTGAFLHKKSSPRWAWWLGEGIVDLAIGAFFVIKPQWAGAFFLFFLALWAFTTGIIQVATSLRLKIYMSNWWVLILTGLFSILFGILIFINPFVASIQIMTIIGVFTIIFGIILVYISRTLKDVYL